MLKVYFIFRSVLNRWYWHESYISELYNNWFLAYLTRVCVSQFCATAWNRSACNSCSNKFKRKVIEIMISHKKLRNYNEFLCKLKFASNVILSNSQDCYVFSFTECCSSSNLKIARNTSKLMRTHRKQWWILQISMKKYVNWKYDLRSIVTFVAALE